VLCEKPLASSVEDAEAMVQAADTSGLVAACGFSYRRSPAVSAISEQIKTGALGEIVHLSGRYWCDYSADPDAPQAGATRVHSVRGRSLISAVICST
jgi:predicted dehydrogenase